MVKVSVRWLFDKTSFVLGLNHSSLRIRMAEHPLWEQIGRGFVHHYYQQFDVDRTQLGTLYSDCSCLTWEGQPFQGKAAIMEKIASLPFQKIQHSITAEDHQPAPDSCVLSMVVGQLKVDDDPVMGFHQLFLLKNDSDKWICTNDMFRLALHNFC
ncbi:nuclear transport factor 2-like isoform X1 [Carcharodon carcharias]|uniref:nuclear transport factor 2-like isoform X1 n=2 Tax=Carcharodon carcharias TaxID=13397 RepID=UPI001B7F561B|nr:nuclear transport factor 2-like isoform X1 [Carcharodon carcharias]